MSDKFSAAESMLGYLYQARYALVLAGERAYGNPSGMMSIETRDDVSFESSESAVEQLQLKHHVNSTMSLSDSSSDLWKTLYIWISQDKHKIDHEEDSLVIVTTAKVRFNTAASCLCPIARDVAKAIEILDEVAKKAGNAAHADYYAAYLALEYEEKERLLGNVTVVSAQPTIDKLDGKLRDTYRWAVEVDKFDHFLRQLEGWWFRRCVDSLSTGQPTPLYELAEFVRDLADQYRSDNLPIDDIGELLAEYVDAADSSYHDRVFMQQLKLVGAGERTLLNSLKDWMLSYAQRSRWIRNQFVSGQEVKRYEDRIVREWEHLFASMEDELGVEAAEEEMAARGRRLFMDATAMSIRLRERCDEPFVLRGSLHMLADETTIGWHVEFRERLANILLPAGVE